MGTSTTQADLCLDGAVCALQVDVLPVQVGEAVDGLTEVRQIGLELREVGSSAHRNSHYNVEPNVPLPRGNSLPSLVGSLGFNDKFMSTRL